MKTILTLFFTTIILASLAFASENESLPLRSVADFQLTGHNGKTVRLTDLKGSVWIADFIFTRCQGACPLITGKMAELQKQLSGSGIKLVSFSVDPEFDTPEVLKKYAEKYQADPAIWYFLTGPKKMIWDLAMESFQLGVESASEEDLKQGAELVMHSNRFVLVDSEGRIQGYFDSNEPGQLTELIRQAREFARKASAA